MPHLRRIFLRLRWAFALRANGSRTPTSYQQEFELELPRRSSSLVLSHDRSSAIVADHIERNSERDNVLEEKQAEVVHVMDAADHDGVVLRELCNRHLPDNNLTNKLHRCGNNLTPTK